MAIGTSKEDLGAFSREDLVYKAKLAEQAERCVRSCARRRVLDDDDAGRTTISDSDSLSRARAVEE